MTPFIMMQLVMCTMRMAASKNGCVTMGNALTSVADVTTSLIAEIKVTRDTCAEPRVGIRGWRVDSASDRSR